MVDRSKHGGGYRVRGGTGRYVASTVDNLAGGDEQEANAARIVACVNALDGIDDPEAFVKAARDAWWRLARLLDGTDVKPGGQFQAYGDTGRLRDLLTA
jgi:hypothetical protein